MSQVPSGARPQFRLSFGAAFLAIALLMHLVIAALLPGPWDAPLAGLMYALVYGMALRTTSSFALILAPICVLHVSMFVSLAAVEAGARMAEIGYVGTPTAASSLYALVGALFISTGMATFRRVDDRLTRAAGLPVAPGRSPLLLVGLPLAFGLAAIAWLMLKGVRSGFPLLMGADRFMYRAVSGDFITLNVLNLKIVVAAFLGVAALRCQGHWLRWVFHGIFISYLCASFLFGDKFFIIISSSLIYVAVQALDGRISLGRRAKYLVPLILLVVLVACAMTVYIYSGGGQLDWTSTARRLLDRVASQSQIWYLAVAEGFQWFRFNAPEALLNLQSLLETPAQDFVFQERLGPFHFIAKYATTSRYWSFIGNQGYVAPIMVWDGYLLELFGLIGLLIGTALTAVIFGVNAAWLAAAVRSRNPFNAILPAHVFVQAYYLVVSGTLYTLFSIGTMKAYLAMLALQLLVQAWLNRTGQAATSSSNLLPRRS